MNDIRLFLAFVIALAIAITVLYVSPFARCGNCPGKRCRRCRGLGRYQRRGSRTVHRIAALIRAEIERTRQQAREDKS